jgi:rod shape-determining protein MreD
MQASVPRLLRPEAAQLSAGMSVAVIVIALLLQIYLPLFWREFGLIDLPLLIVVYLALSRREVASGLLIGAAVGLAQDALTHGPVGLFGIIKTVIGYLAGSVSLVIEVSYPGARGVLAALFFLVQQTLFWVIHRALLASEVDFNLTRTLIAASAHAGLSLVLYSLLDRLKKTR